MFSLLNFSEEVFPKVFNKKPVLFRNCYFKIINVFNTWSVHLFSAIVCIQDTGEGWQLVSLTGSHDRCVIYGPGTSFH